MTLKALAPGEKRECPYHGTEGTKGVGVCRASMQVCADDGLSWGACDGTEILPGKEACDNKLDDDCDGVVNNGCTCIPGTTSACYDGPMGTEGVGVCHGGTHVCNADGMSFGPCTGQQTPVAEVCSNMMDDDCDGMANNGCPCTPGTTSACYDGPMGTEGVGICHGGMHVCNADGMTYGPCTGEQTPTAEDCSSGMDQNCDGFLCGQTEWAERFGDSTAQRGQAVATDANGNIYVTGYFDGAMQIGSTTLVSAGGDDIFVAKLDPKGNAIWAKQFGGTDYERPSALAVDAQGNVIITGSINTAVDFGGGLVPGTMFVTKLDTSGNYVWAKSCGGSTAGYGGTGVAVDAQGDVVAISTFAGTVHCGDGAHPSAGAHNILVAKLAGSNGQPLWSKAYGDATAQTAKAVAIDSTGSVLFTGENSGTVNFGGQNLSGHVYITKLTTSGAHSWSFAWGTGGVVNAIALDALGSPTIVGDLGSVNFGGGNLVSNGGSDVFVAKFGAAGNHVWSKGFGDVDQQHGMGVTVNAGGDVFITGYFTGSIDFGGGALVTGDSHNECEFLARLSSQGKHVWSKLYGDPGPHVGPVNEAFGLALAPSGDVVVTGDFGGTANFGTGPLTSAGGSDVFLMKAAP